MKFLKNKNIAIHKKYLDLFAREYWFAPQDVLLRSVEANIVTACRLKHKILDIGIGDGGVSRFLFSKKQSIDVGIDIEQGGLEKAKRTGVYKKIICADAQHMPFGNASFQTVISNSTFEHIKDDKKAVAEVGRVLKSGGHFFLTVPSIYLPTTILSLEHEEEDKLKAKQALGKFNKRVNHLHYRSIKEWEELLKKNNLSIVFYMYYYPRVTTRLWYRLMKISITKFRKREIWSYLAHSKLRKFIPEKLVVYVLKKLLHKSYYNGIATHNDIGAMLFVVSKKIS